MSSKTAKAFILERAGEGVEWRSDRAEGRLETSVAMHQTDHKLLILVLMRSGDQVILVFLWLSLMGNVVIKCQCE